MMLHSSCLSIYGKCIDGKRQLFYGRISIDQRIHAAEIIMAACVDNWNHATVCSCNVDLESIDPVTREIVKKPETEE